MNKFQGLAFPLSRKLLVPINNFGTREKEEDEKTHTLFLVI